MSTNDQQNKQKDTRKELENCVVTAWLLRDMADYRLDLDQSELAVSHYLYRGDGYGGGGDFTLQHQQRMFLYCDDRLLGRDTRREMQN